MNNLSTTEIKVLNWLSTIRNRAVLLGTILDSLVGSLKIFGTPVNAMNSLVAFGIEGFVKHGDTLTINNPLVPGTDVFEFLADIAQTKSNPNNIPIDITGYSTRAYNTLNIVSQPISGDTMTIGSKIYTFVPMGTDTADGEVSIGSDLMSAQLAIVEAINGTDGINDPHPLVSASDFDGTACVIMAFIGGSTGRGILTTHTFSNENNQFNSSNLEEGGGLDCSDVTAISLIYAAFGDYATQEVSCVVTGDETCNFVANVAGLSGDNILVGKEMDNGSFANGATTLEGGIDGTVGSVHAFMVDGDYLYFTIADNTVSGKNWRRISIGEVY